MCSAEDDPTQYDDTIQREARYAAMMEVVALVNKRPVMSSLHETLTDTNRRLRHISREAWITKDGTDLSIMQTRGYAMARYAEHEQYPSIEQIEAMRAELSW